MSSIVRETSEYVEMSDSITLCIVKDGAAYDIYLSASVLKGDKIGRASCRERV